MINAIIIVYVALKPNRQAKEVIPMLQIGRRLSPMAIIERVSAGRYCLTFEQALATYGPNFIWVQPVPDEVMQFLPDASTDDTSLMQGLFVPSL